MQETKSPETTPEENSSIGTIDTIDKAIQEKCNTPITKEEAAKLFAENDIKKLHLVLLRQHWLSDIASIQERIAKIDLELSSLEVEKAIIYRRTLNIEEATK